MSAELEQVAGLYGQGRLSEARSLLEALVARRPRDVAVRGYLAIVLRELGELEAAEQHARRATELAARDANTWIWLGNVLGSRGRHPEALLQFERALSFDSRSPEAWVGKILSLRFGGKLMLALRAAELAVARCAPHELVFSSRASLLLAAGQARQAYDAAAAGLATFPHSLDLASTLASASNYTGDLRNEDVLEAHRRLGAAVSARYPVRAVPYRQSADPQRPLRVGIVSSDLREHSVAYFISPLLRHADRRQLQLWCYSNSASRDTVTARFEAMADRWCAISTLNDLQCSQKVYDDQIDVLVDLNGNTVGHRLGVFANTPAPVQITYCGYPNTTGVRGIGARLVDAITDPPGSADELATEKLLRLSRCFLCYEPPEQCPSPESAKTGDVTFGSFNMVSKISDHTLALWSEVLATVPQSRLRIKAMALRDSELGDALLGRMERAGLSRDRIELLAPTAGTQEHLAAYREVDIALDTTPYNGTTTTCEALIMGVPVVALAGGRHGSRVSASLLAAAGRSEWIAPDEAGFVSLARTLAEKHIEIRAGRARLRASVLASPLCDGPAFAREFERGVRTLWTQWCGSRG